MENVSKVFNACSAILDIYLNAAPANGVYDRAWSHNVQKRPCSIVAHSANVLLLLIYKGVGGGLPGAKSQLKQTTAHPKEIFPNQLLLSIFLNYFEELHWNIPGVRYTDRLYTTNRLRQPNRDITTIPTERERE